VLRVLKTLLMIKITPDIIKEIKTGEKGEK